MQIFHLELTAEECQIIGIALGAQPYRQVALLIHKMQKQVSAQENAVRLQDEIDAAVEAALDGVSG